MRLTCFSDYSLRVLIYLGLRGDDLSTIRDIAAAYDISRNHLMKVVNFLTRAGYVQAVRGQGGGIRLALAPSEIVLGKVVRETEEGISLAECFGSGNQCVITPECQLRRVFGEALHAFFAVLDGYTLEDLIRDGARTAVLLGLPVGGDPGPPGPGSKKG